MISSTISDSNTPGLNAKMLFLKHDNKFKLEKPYSFKFPGLCFGGPSSNAEFYYQDISLTDLRGNEQSFSVKDNGFSILNIKEYLTYEDYHDELGQSRYLRQIETILKDHLGASRVTAFRHGLRKRHPSFPFYTDDIKSYENDQPTTLVHIDGTAQEASREVQIHGGDQTAELLKKRFQWINVWKPLKGPMNDWPLAICDASTVNRHLDVEASDLVYQDHVAENANVYYNSNQRWYYLSDHQTSEIIVFKQADSLSSACIGVPHGSFANSQAAVDEMPRESIEVRALVFYDD